MIQLVFLSILISVETKILAIVEPFTDYYIGVFGADCNFLIDHDLSCHGSCH